MPNLDKQTLTQVQENFAFLRSYCIGKIPIPFIDYINNGLIGQKEREIKAATWVDLYEKGKRNPNTSLIAAIAKIFGLDPIVLQHEDLSRYTHLIKIGNDYTKAPANTDNTTHLQEPTAQYLPDKEIHKQILEELNELKAMLQKVLDNI